MNHSMYSADRGTHVKIVVLGLICATMVAVVGIFAHATSNIDLSTSALVKAGQPTTMSRVRPRRYADTCHRTLNHAPPHAARAFVRHHGDLVRGAAPRQRNSTILPVNSTGPVGTPLGEPPEGSSDTA